MSLVETKNGIIEWNVGKHGQSNEEFIKGENELINNTFKNVFFVKFKVPKDEKIIINIFEITDVFDNEDFDISVVKADAFSAFVDFAYEDNINNDNDRKIKELVEKIKNKNMNDEKAKWKIEKIMTSKEFYDNYKEIINFKK